MEKKRVNTTIDAQLWKLAQLSDIKWHEAIEIGVNALLGINKEEQDLKAKKQQLSAEIEAISLKISQIQEKNAEKQKKDKESVYITL